MIPSLTYLALCCLSGYAIVRLGQLCDRVEADQLHRLNEALKFDTDTEPPSRAGFLRDLCAAIGLSAAFLTCLFLAFGLGR